jgi:NAD(P)-dependent dehydrogenase (short-subunit alcohol dehydrogenase family)
MKRREFEGQRALVTGAASGIGRACGVELARRGARVVVVDIDEGRLGEAVAEIEAAGGQARGIVCDVSKAERVQALADEVLAQGPVDLLFSNAGVAVVSPVETMKLADWEWLLGVNVWGPILLTRAFLPSMLARGRGHLAATASMAGLVGAPGMAAYSLTKFAMVGFYESLWLEVAGRGLDVTVVCPGYVKTGLHAATRYGNAAFRQFLDEPPAWYGITAERAASRIVDGIAGRERLVLVGPEQAGYWLKRMVPGLASRLTRHVGAWTGILS